MRDDEPDTQPTPSRRHDLSLTLMWVAAGTDRFVRTVADLGPDGLSRPSLLPGWTRAHVVAHVARNADALARLASWARTGTETPMYASPEQREQEIEATAGLPVDLLHADLLASAATLEDAFASMDADAWAARVRSRQGREIRASVLPWMRVRELWLHAVDLDAALTVAPMPPDLVEELLRDVVGTVARNEGCPPVVLEVLDRPDVRPTQLRLGPADRPDAVTVAADATDLLTWVSGRGVPPGLHVHGGALPVLPAWL